MGGQPGPLPHASLQGQPQSGPSPGSTRSCPRGPPRPPAGCGTGVREAPPPRGLGCPGAGFTPAGQRPPRTAALRSLLCSALRRLRAAPAEAGYRAPSACLSSALRGFCAGLCHARSTLLAAGATEAAEPRRGWRRVSSAEGLLVPPPRCWGTRGAAPQGSAWQAPAESGTVTPAAPPRPRGCSAPVPRAERSPVGKRAARRRAIPRAGRSPGAKSAARRGAPGRWN